MSGDRQPKNRTFSTKLVACFFAAFFLSTHVAAQLVANASFELPVVASNTEALRPTAATWSFSGQAGIRNNSAPNGSDGKQVAFLSAAPANGTNNFGAIAQTLTFAPGTYYVRYAAAIKTSSARPQPLKFSINGVAIGGVLSPRYIVDPTTGGLESGWTLPFVITAAGAYTIGFEATNATNYGTSATPQYAVAYLDAITVASSDGSFTNGGFESATGWTLSSGASLLARANAPDGVNVLSLTTAATASQSIALSAGRYSLSLKSGKASTTAALIRVEVASNGAAATTVANITPTTVDEFRSHSTTGFTLPAGTHVVTLRAVGGSMLLDNLLLNDAAPELLNADFETPSLAAPTSASAVGPTSANPTNAQWTFSGTGGQVQGNAGSSNTSAPVTIHGKQFLALSSTGKVSQSLNFEGGVYIAVGQIAQGGITVAIDGVTAGKLSASTLSFREVASLPFAISAGLHSVSLAVDSTYSPTTPKLDEFRLQRIDLPPLISITAPLNGAIFQTGATVNVTASAVDADGLTSLTISRIPNGGTASQLATAPTSPLSASWSNSSANTYTIKAVATDSSGTQNSSSISIRVNANPNAVFSISPSGPVVTSATNVSVTASVTSVSDSDGTVAKVEFLQDGVVNATCTKNIPPAAAPFTCVHTLAPKTTAYAIAIRVTDNDGGVTTTAPLTIRVNTSPSITLDATCTAPCTNPATVNLSAAPTDVNGTISKVEFYDGTTLLTTKTASPWSYAHVNAAVGSHSYTAKAFDNDNATATSAAKAITVTAPSASLSLTAACTAPCNAPGTVALTANAANIPGTVSKVEFYDGTTLLNTDTASPYAFTASSVVAATHSYTAKVYVSGNATALITSVAQSVRVNALPTVSITAQCVTPCANPATVNLSATPADTDGTISKVEFYDGTTLRGTVTAAPWTYTHTNAATGTHNYTAKAFDNDNTSTTSAATSVVVVATPPTSVQLTVICDAPCEAPATATFTASPTGFSANYGSFYNGSTYLGSGNLNPNGTLTGRVTNLGVGAYSVTALVGGGASGTEYTSNAISLSVTAPSNFPPAITWVAPGDGAQINAFGKFILKANASDQDGSIASVKFYIDGVLLSEGALQNGTYVREWIPGGTPQSYQITAVATDNLGKTATAPVSTLSVSAAINFTTPTDTTFYTDSVSNLAKIRFPTVIAPQPEQWQAPYSEWNADTRYVLWSVELLEDGVVVDTQKYGYEVLPYAGTLCDYTFSGRRDVCLKQWAAPIMTKSDAALGTRTYALRIIPVEGRVWQSAPTVMTAVDGRPVVTVSSGATDSAVYEGAVFVRVNAPAFADNTSTGIYENDQLLGSCKVISKTCTYLWSSATVGSHTVTARVANVFTGAIYSTSPPYSFNVVANIKPSAAFVTPVNQASFRSPAIVTLRASASDADGTITKMEFLDNALRVLGVGTLVAGNYEFVMPEVVRDGLNQSVRVGVRAFDNRGAPSNIVSVDYVIHAPAYVNFDAPCLYTTCYAGAIVLSLSSNQSNYILRTRYLRNSVEITPTDVYGRGKVDADLPAGTYVYQVEITTTYGDTALSAPVTVTVLPNEKPTVAITNLVDNTVLYNTNLLTLTATAADSDGTIRNVEFFDNGQSIGFGTLANGIYSLTWGSIPDGVHTLTAQATDDRYSARISTPIKVTIFNGPRPAPNSLVDGALFAPGQTINITLGGSGIDPATTALQLWRVGTNGQANTMLKYQSGTTLSHSLTLPGTNQFIELYTVTQSTLGATRSANIRLLVLSGDIDPAAYTVWINLYEALKAGNKTLALSYLTPSAQAVYAPIFDVVIGQRQTYAAGFLSGVASISIDSRELEYLVARTENSTRLVFSVRFLKLDDGTWKIESM
jgi:hypothetical protein